MGIKYLFLLIFSICFMGCTHMGEREFEVQPRIIITPHHHFFRHNQRQLFYRQRRPFLRHHPRYRMFEIEDELNNLPFRPRYFHFHPRSNF